MSVIRVPTPIQEIHSPLMKEKEIRILVKRDDLTHPTISGNKWRKLKYNLLKAKKEGIETIITYGGAYSNHIAATSAACHHFDLRSIGIIRGEEPTLSSNPTLDLASENGMRFHFVPREAYRRHTSAQALPFEPTQPYLLLPEGGTNENALQGCKDMVQEITDHFDILCVPMGTGGTCAGILQVISGPKEVWGFSALKGRWIQTEFDQLLSTYAIGNQNYRLFQDERFGGYAKFDPDLIQFILDFKQEYGILLDPVYTGKMFFSVWELAKNDQIARGSTLLLIHTGGLQGIAGFNHRHNLALPKP